MAEVSIWELRNHGGSVVDRVVGGEHVTLTRRSKPVAELVPLPTAAVPVAALIRRRTHLPPVDHAEFHRDLDAVIDG